MTLRRFPLTAIPTARACAGLALLTLLGVGIASADTEAVVAGRFAAALEAAPRQTVAGLSTSRTLVSGSEAYWLEKQRHHETGGAAIEPAAWSAGPLVAGLAVGDRITISNAKGDRVLEVTAIADVAPTPGATTTHGARTEPQKVAVTCRDTGDPDGRSVTFEVPSEAVMGTPKPARAL